MHSHPALAYPARDSTSFRVGSPFARPVRLRSYRLTAGGKLDIAIHSSLQSLQGCLSQRKALRHSYFLHLLQGILALGARLAQNNISNKHRRKPSLLF